MVLPLNRILCGGKPKANIGDAIPFLNILPFGTCKSRANPTVAAATAAAQGVLQQMPCTPVCAMWMGGKFNTLVGFLPALMDNCKLACMLGAGTISITDSGQTPGKPTPPSLPPFPILALLMFLDVLVNIINGIMRIESWDQLFAVVGEFASVATDMAVNNVMGAVTGAAAGGLADTMMGPMREALDMAPPPLNDAIDNALGCMQQELQAQIQSDLGQALNSASFSNGVANEYAERGYSDEDAQKQIAGTAPKCAPPVLDALGAYPTNSGGGRA
jgi:hypothetical protein